MNSALGIAVVFDFITLIAVETGLEIFVVGTDVDVVGIVDSVDVLLVIGYWLFDVGFVVENDVIKIGVLNGDSIQFRASNTTASNITYIDDLVVIEQ